MLARLWWKESRMFWPYWLALGLMAALVQWLILRYGGADTRTGVLSFVALGWAILYAFAVGAASFAGERENRTLDWLDTVPVNRTTLWVGKTSFAVVSTFALAGLLLLFSMQATTQRQAPYELTPIVVAMGTFLVEATAWSLFWSSWTSNTLRAAILGIVSFGLVSILLNGQNGMVDLGLATQHTAVRLAIAIGAAAVSYRVITARPRPERDRSIPAQAQASERSTMTPTALEYSEPAHRIRMAATIGRLIWETARESALTWAILTGLSLAVPLMACLVLGWTEWAGLSALLGIILTVAAGVGVFGHENQARTFPFYVDHGVRPALVWLVKEVSWMALVVVGWGIGFATLRILPHETAANPGARERELVFVLWAVVNAFALGQLCGLVFRRSITAGLVALLLIFLVYFPQLGLIQARMVPSWCLAVVPVILLGISFGWTGDWLLDTPGARRWIKLALLTVVPFGLTATAYVSYRAWSVPDVHSRFDPTEVRLDSIPPDENAAEAYRAAASKIRPPRGHGPDDPTIESVIETGWNPRAQWIVHYWEDNREAIELARRASARPRGRFRLDTGTMRESEISQSLRRVRELIVLLSLDARERLSRQASRDLMLGDIADPEVASLNARERQARRERESSDDLAAAWDDIHAIFRMAEVVATSASLMQALMAHQYDTSASRLAISWACDPRQTAESLRAALDDFHRFAPLPSLAESVKREVLEEDQAIDMPLEELDAAYHVLGRHLVERTILGMVVFNPWERVRAHRVLRLLASEEMKLAELEPWQYWELWSNDPRSLAHFRHPFSRGSLYAGSAAGRYLESTPLMKLIHASIEQIVAARDQGLVFRRALEQILALRRWQVEHGSYPERLEQLVPGELASLPRDPHSGRPFGFTTSRGQKLLPLHDVGTLSSAGKSRLEETRPGQKLLYSVGPDGQDDGASKSYEADPEFRGDMIFPLPVFERDRP
jgi:hypothetical protein